MSRSFCRRASDVAFYASLFVSPWIGLGTLRLVTGVDSGAGFQPAYLFLAMAWLLALVGYGPGTLVDICFGRGTGAKLAVLLVVAVGASAYGIVFHSPTIPVAEAWVRFLKQIVQLVTMVAFMLYPVLAVRSFRRWRRVQLVLAVALIWQLVYVALQAGFFFHPWAWFAVVEGWFTSNPAILSGSEELFLGDSFCGIPRLRGTACEPLYLGNWLLMVLPFMFLAGPHSRFYRAVGVAGLLLFVFTWSRGAWLAAGPALVVGAVLARRAGLNPGWRRIVVSAGSIVVALGLFVVLVWGANALLIPWQRLLQSLDQSDWSNLTRVYSLQAGWRAFLLSPVVGVGWGQFGFHFPILVDPLGLQSQFSWPVVNNFPLQILCELGLFGLTVMALAVFSVSRAVWRVLGQADAVPGFLSRDKSLLVIAAVAAVGVWSQLMTFSQYNLPHVWVAPGLLLAALRLCSSTGTRPRMDLPAEAGGEGE